MLRIVTFVVLSFISFQGFCQGSIAGTVTDNKTNEAIIGANVIIQGTTIGAATDIEGKFLISNVAAGTYTIQISYLTYKTQLIPNVVVEDAKRITLSVPLVEDVIELQDVVITVGRQTDTDFDMLKSIKESKVIMVGVTSEQITRSLDRDAAQVIKRVPGINIKDDQFIMIRGIAERYNPVLLHNVFAPSVETDVKSFSFATIPSSQIDRIQILKSPSADITGDFAGGVTKIYTKSIPEERGIIVDYSTQYRVGTTMQDFYHQQQGSGYLTGFNTGFYDLPGSFPANASNIKGIEQVDAGRSLKNLWKPQKGTAIPDQRLTLTFNNKFNIGRVQVGNITALSYSNSYGSFNVTRGDYTESPGKVDQNFSYSDKQYNQLIRAGALFNWAFKFSPTSTIEWKNLYNQSSVDQYVDRTGTGVSTGQQNGSFDKVYRGIYSGQLLGSHDLFHRQTTVEWVTSYNNSYRDQPDYKRYQSLGDPTNGYQLNVPNTVTPTALGRYYGKLNEHAYAAGGSIKQRFAFTGNPLQSPELKAGFYYEQKDRSFSARNIGYTQSPNFNNDLSYLPVWELFQPQNINNTTGVQIGEITYKKDSYSASNKLLAYYLTASIPISKKLKLDAGLRVENNLQTLNSYDDFKQQPVNVHNQVNRHLPSANMSYNFTDKMLIRTTYGQTLNRPEFRELAPFSFYDFNFNFIYSGNPSLKTAKIQNYDVRWELYPSKLEMITFGAFYKDFTNPIESYVDINSPGGGVKNIIFANSQSAIAYGLETEVKKSLGDLGGSRLMKNLGVLFNATLQKSNVHVAPQYATGRSAQRPLQGQAPYLFNAGVFYTSQVTGWQVNLLYNVVGKNVYLVGIDSYHDIYQMPRNVIDLVFNKQLGSGFSIKGGVTDLLSQPILLLQDGNGDKKLDRNKDQVISKFKPGQVFSLGLNWRI